MAETKSRVLFGEGLMIVKRLRTLKHRATRWFLPPVRSLHGDQQSRPAPAAHEPGAGRVASRDVKQSALLQ